MKRNSSKRWLLALLALLLGSGVWFAGREEDHPSDAALLANFSEHAKEFEELVKMLREDQKLVRIDDNWTDPEDPSSVGIGAERVRMYRDLFKRLDIPRGFYAFRNPEEFTFISSAKGLAVTGSSKGYVYRMKRPEDAELVSDLDEGRKGRSRSFVAYRYIKENWYLYFDYDD